MKVRVFTVFYLAVCVGLFFVSASALQEPKQETDPAMEAFKKAGTPGEHHKHLEMLNGTWNVIAKYWTAPGAPPSESTGVGEHKAMLGGRFVQTAYESTFMGQPFVGIGYSGYDNQKKKYVEVWMDTLGTMILTSEGHCDGTGKVRTMTGAYHNPMTGNEHTMRSVMRIEGPDKLVLEMFDKAPGSEEFKTMELVYTRK